MSIERGLTGWRPASRLAKSSMSPILACRCRPAAPMSWAYSTYLGWPGSPKIALLDHFREADDGVQRRAQFVAHMGDEFGLGAFGFDGAALGIGQPDQQPRIGAGRRAQRCAPLRRRVRAARIRARTPRQAPRRPAPAPGSRRDKAAASRTRPTAHRRHRSRRRPRPASPRPRPAPPAGACRRR